MGLEEDRKAELRSQLAESKVPERAWNIPLSKMGDSGSVVRDYIKQEYGTDAKEGRGAVFVGGGAYLAASFARDIVIAGASTEFYYLQTFASRTIGGDNLPQSIVMEWFEQKADSPFSGKERYLIETRLMGLMDSGFLLYLFTSVHPQASKWWSPNLAEAIAQNCRIIEVEDANRRGGERTSLITPKTQRSKNPRKPSRVTVR